MDAFELIRASARQLHEELVGRGVDPLDPPRLVEAAVARLELEHVFLPVGDPALKGARAVLDEQTGTIRSEDAGSAVERAILIAHELGHVRVHVGSAECTAEDIDASRSTESAPVGLQRVEDYGVRERRELQANVFARELVFPRTLARRLHKDEGLSASDIVERTGLPLALIRQQIFDALLLPSAVAEEPRVSAPARADPAQDRAVVHRGSPFQLQAGPGTGKTRTLVKRIVSLVEEKIDPSSILTLTFSNRAAGELAERISAVLPEAAPRLWVGTFHSFGLDLLRRHGDRIGLSPDPSLFDRSDAIAVLEDILPTLPLSHYRNLWDPTLILREVLNAISRAKDEVVDAAGYRNLAEQMREAATDDDGRTAAEKCLEVAEIYERYEAAKRERGAVDFGDLVMLPALLLEKDAPLAASVRLRHRHLLVDEYQDVNRASVRLVKALAGDAKRLWVVGDARQSIYRFRGASSGNMASFSTDFPGATIDRLEVSYRSTREIISAFTGFAVEMSASKSKDMLPLALDAVRGHGAVPEIRRFDAPDDEAAGVAASILELQAAGVKLRDQAVLCRTNAKLDDIASALEVRGIPVLHLGSLFERDDVRDLLALLSLAVDPFGDGLVRVGAMTRYAVPLQDIHVATRKLRALDRPALAGLSEVASDSELSLVGSLGLTRLANDLRGLRAEGMAWDFLATYLLDRAGLVREMATRDTVSAWMRSAAIWQFLNFIREQSPVGGNLPIRRTLDRIRQLVLLAEERDLRQVPANALHMDAVRLMTVHGSKGLEFEAVHIPGMTKVGFPSGYKGQRVPPPVGLIADAGDLSVKEESQRSHAQEEECLFFVAMSRARSHLRMYLSRTQDNGDARAPSPFLERLAAGSVRDVGAPATLPLPPDAPRPTPIVVTYPPEHRVTDGRLGLFRKCPRRFFYTHVLGLGGGRRQTAFSRTHDCLYRLMDWLAEERLKSVVELADAESAFEDIWIERGPADHAFAAEYRELASRIIGALVRSGDGRQFRKADAIELRLPGGTIAVEPDEIVELHDGTVVLRRVRTGYRRSEEYKDADHIEYALYILAGRQEFGRGARVEAVHLTDEAIDPVEINEKIIGNRTADAVKMLAGISSGMFPAKPEPVSCARCPHFFVCAAVPAGDLNLI